MASCKWPPKLSDESRYENWKTDVEIWCKLTDIPKKKQALAIHLSLCGRARIASSEIPVSDLEVEEGVDAILKKLDGLFLVDKGRRQFEAFRDLFNLRRPSQGNVREFMSEFEHTYFKFTKQGMSLPDSVMAFMLLASCSLSDQEQQLVMSGISEVTFQNMKSALSRIFHREIHVQHTQQSTASMPKPDVSVVKSESVFLGDGCEGADVDDEGHESFFVRGSRREISRGLMRGYRPRGSFPRGRGVARRQNPLGPDGRITRCMICDSRFHWARQCPDAYENKGNTEHVERSMNGRRERNKDGGCDAVNFSMFVGYANGDRENKLNKLVEEAKCCAVLDSGCSTTVCGAKWLDEFLNGFSDVERGSIVEEESKATFTFGDGVTVTSTGCVTVPCSIGGIRGTIRTEVIDCNIPLLLSKSSMKKAKMVVNFALDQVFAYGRHIDLKTSSSGHYLLPLSD